ncbi:MAG TPA: DUF1697 domain-containing protein [Vicinamibacterales bacterium]|nr:DUF1697 domain-containing protein [Vicinamibacterales bacterium]
MRDTRRSSWTSADVPRAIGLLRAVNVGGRVLPMQHLRELLSELGYVEPTTLLQSGNVVFGFVPGAPAERASEIEARIEAQLLTRLSLQSDVFVRSPDEWDDIVAKNPFPREAEADPAHLLLMTLRAAPAEAVVAALRRVVKGRETMAAWGRHLYIVYPDGVGRSTLTGGVIERALGTRGTARNWNTVLKLAALARAWR